MKKTAVRRAKRFQPILALVRVERVTGAPLCGELKGLDHDEVSIMEDGAHIATEFPLKELSSLKLIDRCIPSEASLENA
jgi:hypothetical protein